MLKPLPDNQNLVDEEYRRRFADGSTSLTMWFDESDVILCVEIIFDLLMDEHSFRWVRNTKSHYLKVRDEEIRPEKNDKQILGIENLAMPDSRLEEFNARSANLPAVWRDFICEKLTELIES
jgi:hypothetical protein